MSAQQHLRFSDIQLSAFLDAALPEPDMELIRQALTEDDALVNRLAELAMVDTLVEQCYRQIDNQPLPAELQALAQQHSNTDNVVPFRRIKQAARQWQLQAAAVALVSLITVFSLTNRQATDSLQAGTDAWQRVSDVLQRQPSGKDYVVADVTVTPRLSFISNNGQFCRQYGLQQNGAGSEHIACRSQNQWQLEASADTGPTVTDSSGYQTASGGRVLDDKLDQLMTSAPLSPAAEQQYLTTSSQQ